MTMFIQSFYIESLPVVHNIPDAAVGMRTHSLTYSLNHLLTYSLTHLLTYSLTHLLTHLSTGTMASIPYLTSMLSLFLLKNLMIG